MSNTMPGLALSHQTGRVQDDLLEFQTRFKKNLYAIKKVNPPLYEAMKVYVPVCSTLQYDSNNNLNINQSGQWMYSKDPYELAEKQFLEFDKNPAKIINHIQISEFQNGAPKSIHQMYISLLSEYHNQKIKKEDEQDRTKEYIPYIVFFGAGCGHHINIVTQKRNLRHIVIYEPDADLFYLSLFTCDYHTIIENFHTSFRSIQFYVSCSIERLLEGMYVNSYNKNNFEISQCHMFQHYNSTLLDEAIAYFQRFIYKIYSTSGFLEDELYGVSHWIKNTQSNYKLLKKSTAPENMPAIIIGSGPSIDKNIELIKQLKDKAVIISCSSSIMICLKNNIMPDLHAEVERLKNTSEFLDEIQQDKLKDITLIALNTIHPYAASKFKQTIFGLKSNDLAATLSRSFLKNNNIETNELTSSNPTSVNGAFSMAIELGFTKIILAGVDLGFKNENEHHSKDTMYFNPEKKWHLDSIKSTFTFPGNFGGTVQSTQLLETTKTNLEKLAREHPHIHLINSSDGARINGFQTITLENVVNSLSLIQDKKTGLSRMLENQFSMNTALSSSLKHEWKNILQQSKEVVTTFTRLLQKPQDSHEYMYDLLEIQRDDLNKFIINNKALKIYVEGSLETLQLLATIALANVKEGPRLQKHMQSVFLIIDQYLKDATDICQNNKNIFEGDISIEKYKVKFNSIKNSLGVK